MAVKLEGLEGSIVNAEIVFAPAYIKPYKTSAQPLSVREHEYIHINSSKDIPRGRCHNWGLREESVESDWISGLTMRAVSAGRDSRSE